MNVKRNSDFDPIEWLDCVGSTNTRLKAMIGPDAGWMAVVARRQDNGRGRLGRQWKSPAGGLYLSVCRPLGKVAAPIWISAAAALGCVEAVEAEIARPVALRWPNDLLVGDAKLAGVLSELVLVPGSDPVVIVGIGLNGNATITLEDGRNRAVSLAQLLGRDVVVADVVGRVLAAIAQSWRRLDGEGHAWIAPQWDSRSALSGQVIDVQTQRGTRRGRCLGIGPDFALLVEVEGQVERIIEGDATRVVKES